MKPLFSLFLPFILCSLLLLLFTSKPTTAVNNNVDNFPASTFTSNNNTETHLTFFFDWIIVGSAFFSCFSGLTHGPTVSLAVQRWRGLRPVITGHCSMRETLQLMLATPVMNQSSVKSILDRADTPTGFALDVSPAGWKYEGKLNIDDIYNAGNPFNSRYLVGMIWANACLAVAIILCQMIIAQILEKIETSSKKKASGGLTSAPTDDKSKGFFAIAAKWGLGRCVHIIVALPIFSALRISIILAVGGNNNPQLPDEVLIHAYAGCAVHGVFAILWFIIVPHIASKRCFVDKSNEDDEDDVNNNEVETYSPKTNASSPKKLDNNKNKEKEKDKNKNKEKKKVNKGVEILGIYISDGKTLLKKLIEEKAHWLFEKVDGFDTTGYIVIPTIQNFNSEKNWYFLPIEFLFTLLIDVLPLVVGQFTETSGSSGCFAHALTGVSLSVVFFLLLIIIRPYCRRSILICNLLLAFCQFGGFLAPVFREKDIQAEDVNWASYIIQFIGTWALFVLTTVFYLLLPGIYSLWLMCCLGGEEPVDLNNLLLGMLSQQVSMNRKLGSSGGDLYSPSPIRGGDGIHTSTSFVNPDELGEALLGEDGDAVGGGNSMTSFAVQQNTTTDQEMQAVPPPSVNINIGDNNNASAAVAGIEGSIAL